VGARLEFDRSTSAASSTDVGVRVKRLYRGQHVRVLSLNCYTTDFVVIDTIVEDTFLTSFRGLVGGFFLFNREGVDWVRLPATDEEHLAFQAAVLLR
jgi:hypothetical protein